MTREEAVAMAATGWWKGKPAAEVALFQLQEERLCMDFSDFHAAVEEALGFPVWTHEFALRDNTNKWVEIIKAKGDKDGK